MSDSSEQQHNIIVYTSDFCGFCTAAKSLLTAKGLQFEEINVSRDLEKRQEMMDRSGRRTVPQIFFGDQHIGGFTDLDAYFRNQPVD